MRDGLCSRTHGARAPELTAGPEVFVTGSVPDGPGCPMDAPIVARLSLDTPAARDGRPGRSSSARWRGEVNAAYAGNLRKLNAGLSFLLTIVTLGIYGLFVLHRMNRYWWDAQVLEQDFDDKLSQTWTKLDLMRYPLSFNVDQSKRRGYALYLILSIVTFGIWGLVWDYKIHTDPDNLYASFHSVEDTVLQTVRAH
jgi:hypothetical protein